MDMHIKRPHPDSYIHPQTLFAVAVRRVASWRLPLLLLRSSMAVPIGACWQHIGRQITVLSYPCFTFRPPTVNSGTERHAFTRNRTSLQSIDIDCSSRRWRSYALGKKN
jgi:hypothetical protein